VTLCLGKMIYMRYKPTVRLKRPSPPRPRAATPPTLNPFEVISPEVIAPVPIIEEIVGESIEDVVEEEVVIEEVEVVVVEEEGTEFEKALTKKLLTPGVDIDSLDMIDDNFIIKPKRGRPRKVRPESKDTPEMIEARQAHAAKILALQNSLKALSIVWHRKRKELTETRFAVVEETKRAVNREGLSELDAAAALGVSRMTVRKWIGK
jgi:hypothetical protein